MDTTKAAYWIALAVVAMALNSAYHRGKFPALHSAVNATESRLCPLVTRAEQTFAIARAWTGHQNQEFRVDDDFLAREQAQMARVMAEEQADLARDLAEQQVDLARTMDLRRADVDCVHQKVDRMRMVLDRAQGQRLRVLERARIRIANSPAGRLLIVCPKTGIQVRVHADGDLPDMDNELSEIEVGDSF